MTLVLLVALALQSNAEALAGRVIDTASVPVPGALVEVDGHGVTVSDEHGGSRFAQRVTRQPIDLRIHRSAIVRLDHIAEVQPAGSSRYRVTLVDGTTAAARVI